MKDLGTPWLVKDHRGEIATSAVKALADAGNFSAAVHGALRFIEESGTTLEIVFPSFTPILPLLFGSWQTILNPHREVARCHIERESVLGTEAPFVAATSAGKVVLAVNVDRLVAEFLANFEAALPPVIR